MPNLDNIRRQAEWPVTPTLRDPSAEASRLSCCCSSQSLLLRAGWHLSRLARRALTQMFFTHWSQGKNTLPGMVLTQLALLHTSSVFTKRKRRVCVSVSVTVCVCVVCCPTGSDIFQRGNGRWNFHPVAGEWTGPGLLGFRPFSPATLGCWQFSDWDGPLQTGWQTRHLSQPAFCL